MPVGPRRRLIASTLVGLLGGACTGDDDMTGDDASTDADTAEELSHDDDIQPIWAAHDCLLCHQPDGPGAVLDLSVDPHAAMVGVASQELPSMNLIEPGDAAGSYMVAKIRGTHLELGGQGSRMPAGIDAEPLPEATIMTIEAWIDAGAAP